MCCKNILTKFFKIKRSGSHHRLDLLLCVQPKKTAAKLSLLQQLRVWLQCCWCRWLLSRLYFLETKDTNGICSGHLKKVSKSVQAALNIPFIFFWWRSYSSACCRIWRVWCETYHIQLCWATGCHTWLSWRHEIGAGRLWGSLQGATICPRPSPHIGFNLRSVRALWF